MEPQGRPPPADRAYLFGDPVKTYILFGLRNRSIDDARTEIEAALRIQMDPHESGYHCGAYFRLGRVGAEHFILQKNYDDFEREWTEPDHKKYEVLFYANETTRGKEIVSALANVADVLSAEDL